MKRQFNAELFVIVWKGNLIRRCLSLSGFGDTRYIIDIMILRAHGIYSIWRNMAHVGLKDRFELPHSVARLFNVVKILGSAVTAVRSVVNIVYDFVVGGNVNDHAESVNATSREEVDRFVAFVDNLLFIMQLTYMHL